MRVFTFDRLHHGDCFADSLYLMADLRPKKE